MRLVIMTIFMLLSCQTIGQVQSFTLDNGLKVLVKEDHRAPVAICMMWYNVGSADEPSGLTGMSHALEHLMFKGTTRYPLGVFSKTIASFGGQENASTTTDYTVYYEKIPIQQIPLIFELEADRMNHLRFDPQEFNKEMSVIREERRLRIEDKPQALVYEKFLSMVDPTSPYHHPVIGWMNDLNHMPLHEVKAWYQRFYTPDHATLVVVGDVDAPTIEALAKKYFGHIKTTSTKKRPLQPIPSKAKKKTWVVGSTARTPIVIMSYPVPTVKTVSPDRMMDPYTLEIIAGILNSSHSGRFTSSLVQQKNLASHVDVLYNLYSRFPTQFVFFGTPSQTHTTNDLVEGIQKELERLKQEPISDKELLRVKKQIIAQKIFEADSQFNQAMEIGMLETIGLGWQTSENYVKRINSVTPKQVQAVSQRYFKDIRLSTVHSIYDQTHKK